MSPADDTSHDSIPDNLPRSGTSAPAAAAPSLPTRIVLEQPRNPLRRVLVGGLLLALGLSVMFNFGLYNSYKDYVQTDSGIKEKLHSGEPMGSDKIAIITVRGAIMKADDGFVKKQIDRVLKDDQVKAVVLRVDSPGGTVTASHFLYHHLKKLQKEKKIPMVVSMGSMAASGGYYISMAVGDTPNSIFAEPTTWTGSIGVIIPSYDLSELMAEWKIRDRSFTSGNLKQMGSPTRSLSPDQRKVEEAKLQQLVDESFLGFKEVVAYGRPKVVQDEEAMEEVVTGQIFTAKQAHRLGLVDRLGYLDDAVKRAAQLADVNPETARVIQYEKPTGLLEVALGRQSQSRGFDLSVLLDLTAPRAYYLCTWLPSVVTGASTDH